MRCRWRFIGFVVSMLAFAGPACAGNFPSVPPVASYGIEARLDVNKKTLDAAAVLRYRNRTGQALNDFPFHLYLNGFQSTASFMQELRRDNPKFAWKDKYYGAIELRSLKVAGFGDLLPQARYIQPDDHNRDDKTVLQVHLPQALAPGDEIEFTIDYHAQLPEIVARTGYTNDFFMVAQWFPRGWRLVEGARGIVISFMRPRNSSPTLAAMT